MQLRSQHSPTKCHVTRYNWAKLRYTYFSFFGENILFRNLYMCFTGHAIFLFDIVC